MQDNWVLALFRMSSCKDNAAISISDSRDGGIAMLLVSCGEGGALLINNPLYYEKAEEFEKGLAACEEGMSIKNANY